MLFASPSFFQKKNLARRLITSGFFIKILTRSYGFLPLLMAFWIINEMNTTSRQPITLSHK